MKNLIRNIKINRFLKRHPKEIQRCIERGQYLVTTYTGRGYFHHVTTEGLERELEIMHKAGYNVFTYGRIVFIAPMFHVKHERRK